MSDFGYVAAAFAVVWVGLAVYMFALMQREKALRKDIAELKERIK
jgi:CcmD family protein